MNTTAQIKRTRHEKCAIVSVVGELDLTSTCELVTALARTITPDRPTVLDLSAVTFMDAAGTHILTAASRTARQQRAVLIVVPSPAVARVLDPLPPDPVLTLRPDLHSALTAL